jgi:hypothetical protein
MRVFIVNADYADFLRDLYQSNPVLLHASYDAQMQARNDTLFGVADFHSRNFKAHGHEAVECHVNNRWMQYTWAKEHGLHVSEPAQPGAPNWKRYFRGVGGRARNILRNLAGGSGIVGISDWDRRILEAQIEEYEPDIILNQEMYLVRSHSLSRVKGRCRIVGQNAAILPENDNYSAYDLLISSLPNYVQKFRHAGKRAELNLLAFEPSVLERMGPVPDRDIELSFVGSLSPNHSNRITFLEKVARNAPLKIWGNSIERLPASSPLHACYQKEVWGREMYDVLRRSRITLNKHIDIAENYANNLRLFEATGMGAALVTDQKSNLAEIFVPDEEVVSYNSADDCLRQIDVLMRDEGRRERIAAAGQRRAVEQHNYFNRVGEMIGLFEALI